MSHTPRAVCVPCKVEMRPSKNGVAVEMLLPTGKPYYIVDADEYACPRCGHKALAGFARECAHDDSKMDDLEEPEHHDGRSVVYVEDVGYTCADPQTVCYECDSDDGEANENTIDGEYPCATLKALDLP